MSCHIQCIDGANGTSKAKESLGSLMAKGAEFKQEFNKMVHHVICEKEFEDGWACMLDKYGLQKNTFLTQIYETRRKWAKPYFMNVFCAKMTSVQRSESANHLLKGYVPPGSPMHLFVRQYEKMRFDRDSEESYQEKRTKLVLIEIVPHREYIARHVKKDSEDKWCKNEFLVQVNELVDEFKCECGMFEHFGMVCGHALKVMIQLGLQEVPAKHVLKRWTRDARDMLPPEFLHYQKDQGPLKYFSRRHNNLHLLCLEIVRLGDSNVDAYTLAMEQLRNAKALLEPVAVVRDGMGLSDREMAGDSAGSSIAHKQHFGPTNQVRSVLQCLKALGHHPRRDQRGGLQQAATKRHMNSRLKGAGFVQSAVVRGIRALRVRNAVIFRRRQGSRLAASGAV